MNYIPRIFLPETLIHLNCYLERVTFTSSFKTLFVVRYGRGRDSTRYPVNLLPVLRRRRWVDNIRMELQEVGCGYVEWIGLAQDRDRWRTFVSAVMNLRVP